MKFFNFILISSYHVDYWACPDDAQDTPEPFPRLCYLYSKHRNQLPKNGDPNTFCSTKETPAEEVLTYVPLTSSSKHLHSMMEDIQHADEHDPYLQHPSEWKHSQHYISELSNLDNEPEYHPEEYDNDTWLPKLSERLNDLQNESSYDYNPYSKGKKFIETKVSAMKLQGFNLF
jgi:hypothetical protein